MMSNMKYPKYLYRSDDFSIFEDVGDGTFSHQMNAERDWIGNVYDYELLISLGFKPCTEDDFPELKRKHDFHYGFISWQGRPDGHGGSKGGTKDEYLEYLDRVKRYQLQKQEAADVVND